MKPFFVFMLLACLAFPCFSQNAPSERFRALSEAMERTLSASNSNLENYSQDSADSENMKTYTNYRRKYESLSNALKSSEMRLDRYLRTNDKASVIKNERDNYENLINELQTTKNEYDNWLRNVR